MIEAEMLERLRSLTARTGLSTSEQIRQAIRWWLEAREWPLKKQPSTKPLSAASDDRSSTHQGTLTKS